MFIVGGHVGIISPRSAAAVIRIALHSGRFCTTKCKVSGNTFENAGKVFWEISQGVKKINMASSSRSSSSSQTPRKLKIGAGSVVCQEAEIKGEVIIGSKTVVHPKARIIAEAGPIIIGDNNLIEEQATIINPVNIEENEDGLPERILMQIGSNNVFEVGSLCESVKVGDNNILEAKSKVGRQTVLSHGCVIGAKCEVTSQETIPENTVIYGSCCTRRVQAERPVPQSLQLDFLSKILPNYHHMKKSSRS